MLRTHRPACWFFNGQFNGISESFDTESSRRSCQHTRYKGNLMKLTLEKYPRLICALTALLTSGAANATLTIDTSNPVDWKISNGVIAVDWLPGNGRIFSMHWKAFPNQEMIDQTNSDHNGPKGFYMDNVGPGSGTPTNTYYLDPAGAYIDWYITSRRAQRTPSPGPSTLFYSTAIPASISTLFWITALETSPAASDRFSGCCEAI
jgi:hypothetical protein